MGNIKSSAEEELSFSVGFICRCWQYFFWWRPDDSLLPWWPTACCFLTSLKTHHLLASPVNYLLLLAKLHPATWPSPVYHQPVSFAPTMSALLSVDFQDSLLLLPSSLFVFVWGAYEHCLAFQWEGLVVTHLFVFHWCAWHSWVFCCSHWPCISWGPSWGDIS